MDRRVPRDEDRLAPDRGLRARDRRRRRGAGRRHRAARRRGRRRPRAAGPTTRPGRSAGSASRSRGPARCRPTRTGTSMAAALAADGVSLDLVQRTDLPTTRALAELDERGEARYRFDRRRDVRPGARRRRARSRRCPADVAAVHVGTLGLVFEPIASDDRGAGGRRSAGDTIADGRSELPAVGDRRTPRPTAARLRRILARADVVKVSDGRPRLPGLRDRRARRSSS